MNFRGLLFALSPLLVAASVADEITMLQKLVAEVDDYDSKIEEQAAEIKFLKSLVQEGTPSADEGSNLRRLMSAKSPKTPKQEETCKFTEAQCNGDVFSTNQICEAFFSTMRAPPNLNCTPPDGTPIQTKPLLARGQILTAGNNYTGCDGDLSIVRNGLSKFHLVHAHVVADYWMAAPGDDCAEDCKKDRFCKYAYWDGSSNGGYCKIFYPSENKFFDHSCGWTEQNCLTGISQLLWAKCDAAAP